MSQRLEMQLLEAEKLAERKRMQLWVQSDNPDYQKAVDERLAELRAKGEKAKREWSKPGVKEAKEYRAKMMRFKAKLAARRKAERAELKAIEAAGEGEGAKRFRANLRVRNKLRLKKNNNIRAFAARLGHCEDSEQFKRDLFDSVLALVPRGKGEVMLRAEPPKETGHLSDSQFWNGYEWERD